MEKPPAAVVEAVEEITGAYRSLQRRPTVEEVEAAMAVIRTASEEEELKMSETEKMVKPLDLSDELFSVLQQVRKSMASLRSYEQRREAQHVVELDKRLQAFDELIRRASRLVSGKEAAGEEGGVVGRGGFVDGIEEELIKNEPAEKRLDFDASMRSLVVVPPFKSEVSSGGDTEKLSLMKVASLIETSVKDETGILDLQGKLKDQVEWLPMSLGKLQHVTEVNLSENRIMALPFTIGSLRSLTKLDIHSNQLINLPDSIGELSNLIDLDLHANRLRSLPTTFGNLTSLVSLDLSSNQISIFPESLGNLTRLKRLNVEANELEELPYTIGSCCSLTELRLDFNQVKALPEAIGKLECLEVLTLHYNRVKGLPTTMCSLFNLKELDVSFNELELIPESLCFATNLVKLNVGNNFTDLRVLPRSIGNLEMLEELNISNDQIRVLPASFRFLSKLKVFHADETPLEVPPSDVIKLGAQAVVQYMADLVTRKDLSYQPAEKRGFWFWLCSLCQPSK